VCVRRADRYIYGRPGRAGVGPRKAEILGGQDHPERAEVRPFFPPPFRTRGVQTHGPLAGMHRAHCVHSSVRSGRATVSGFGARVGAPLACKRYTSRPRSVVAPAYACPLAVRRCCCCIVVLLWALLAIRTPIRPPGGSFADTETRRSSRSTSCARSASATRTAARSASHSQAGAAPPAGRACVRAFVCVRALVRVCVRVRACVRAYVLLCDLVCLFDGLIV
jgi:hypothetical protein